MNIIQQYVPTIGVDYGVKGLSFHNRDLRLNLFDLSGHPSFNEVRSEFYKDAEGALLVYDVNIRSSFELLDNWLKEATRYAAPPNMAVVLVGNKTDVNNNANNNNNNNRVGYAEAKRWADQRGFLFVEASAESGVGVKEAFNLLLEKIIANTAKNR